MSKFGLKWSKPFDILRHKMMSKLGPKWSQPFDMLRHKWSEVPAGGNLRLKTTDLLSHSSRRQALR